MRIFKTKWFHKWSKKLNLRDEVLKKAISEVADGGYEASLGGCLYKKRLPRVGRGKRGGFRIIIAFNAGDYAFFIYGYLKSRQDNFDERDRRSLIKLAKDFLKMDVIDITRLLVLDELVEVK